MAEKENKYEDNAEGKFYVDEECIDCNLCRETAQTTLQIMKTDTLTSINNPKTKKKSLFALKL